MTEEQFWHGDPQLVVAYREADRIRRDREAFAEWRNGFYTQRAFAASWNKENKYPEEPLFLSKNEEREEQRERFEFEKNLASMEAFAASFNAKFNADG